MADAAYKTRSAPYTGLTLGDILDFFALIFGGGTKADFGTDERAVYVAAINNQVALWRLRHKFQLWGLFHTDLTWTAGNTREELPTSFGELAGTRILKKDSGGEFSLPIEVYDREDFEAAYQRGIGDHPTADYDDDLAVAYIGELSTNSRRFLHISPTPSGSEQYRIPYYARAEKLVNNGDAVDAPPEAGIGIQFGAAMQIALARNPSKVPILNALEEKAREALKSPEARLTPRIARVLPFEGYEKLRHGVDGK